MTLSQQPSAARVDEALERVYARPEFVERETWAWLQALTDATTAILDAIRRIIADALSIVGSAVGSHTFTALMVAASLIVVVFVISRLAGGNRIRRRPRTRSPRAPAAAPAERDAEYWDAEAERAIREGRVRDAAFALYHTLVLRLDERGALRFEASKTPGDYRREVVRDADASRALDGFLELFEPLAWGRHGQDADTLQRLRAAAAQASGHG